MKKQLIAILLAVFLTGCTSIKHTISNSMQSTWNKVDNKDFMEVHQVGIPVTGKVGLKPFDKIETNGFYELEINTGEPRHEIEITGDRDIVQQVIVRVANNTLSIKMPENINFRDTGKLTVKITSRDLKYLRYLGTGNITSEHMYVNNLTIDAFGSGTINFLGETNLKRLNYTGPASMSMYWIDSPKLTIRAGGKGKIFLAGQARYLDAEIADNINLDAKYLRTRKAYINTRGSARADVIVLDSLNILATDSSNVYYYLTPRLLAPYMRDRASIISMVNYNKL